MCCDAYEYDKSEINRECPECGIPTVDGVAYIGCGYSPVICKTCQYSPCDGSC